MNKLKGCIFNIGLDWFFLVGCVEIWVVVNVLVLIMLLEVIVLFGNKFLLFGGIIVMGVIFVLLVVIRGKFI